MKRIVIALLMASATGATSAANVGVSVSIGEPGFYGQINIGNAPAPVVVNPQPVIIERGPTYVEQQPIYLRVPPEHQRNWRRHCREYNACDRPVHFVDSNWYNKVYVPHYREHRGYYEEHERRYEERRDRPGPRHEEREREERRGDERSRGQERE
jgi:hypothetical protein